nr:hypothetical protein 17 [bacterium]
MTLQAEKVRNFFTAPLLDAFPSLTAGMCRTAIQRMGDLSEDVLRKTADWLIDNCKQRPAIAEMLETAQRVQAEQPGAKRPADESLCPWQVAQREAREMATEYAKQFKSSTIYRQASQEGWAHTLERYVQDMAWVQAQALVGLKNRGWQSAVLLPPLDLKERSLPSYALFKRYVLPEVEAAMELGHINVTVPGWLDRTPRRQVPPRKNLGTWKQAGAA